jgi:5-methylcytosine-specific restriction protein B
MPISDIYRQKSNELNKLLQNNPQASQQLGRDFFDLYLSWNAVADTLLTPIPANILQFQSPNALFGQTPDLYSDFAIKIIALNDSEESFNHFHDYIYQICDKHNLLPWVLQKPRDRRIGSHSCFQQVVSFFLSLKYPDRCFPITKTTRKKITSNLEPYFPFTVNTLNGRELSFSHYQAICENAQQKMRQHNCNSIFKYLDVIENPPSPPQINTNMPSLNTILYGPPGTGKTFNTIDKALEIIEPSILEQQNNEIDKEYRIRLKNRFDELVNSKQIRFVTFHQSYSYEEFVEGIKAETVDEQIKYEIKPGVFKKICEDAQIPSHIQGLDGVGDNPRIWKISICSASQNPTKDYCYQNGEARIGWGHVGDLNLEVNLDDPCLKIGLNDKSTLTNFSKDMAKGDILLSIKSNTHVEAIGVITSDYYYDDHQLTGIPSDYRHVRKVKWLFTNQSYDISKLNNNRRLTQKTVYELSRISWSKLAIDLHNLDYAPFNGVASKKPFVLIIDEINRGNISKIFGELITLIEESKRAGNDEALTVTLPYSNEPFSVPNNLYIIGTMNTADRSLALMDTALRRRFDFVEMMPEPDLLTDGNDNDVMIGNINIREMLESMNQRIEVLYDREHTLGHAFFMSLIDTPTIENLAGIFKNKIIPLLQEYFFEDWEKIRIVLGDDNKTEVNQFVRENSNNLARFSEAVKTKYRLNDVKSYSLNDVALSKPESYIGVYQ